MKAVVLVTILTATLVPLVAAANPHPNPFSYPYETLPADQIEIEQYIDLVPVLVEREKPDGTKEGVYDTSARLTTELEVGITDHLEFGFYFAFGQGASADAHALTFDGVKQRLRYRFAEVDEWPVNVGLYLEVAELHDELEIEEKILLAKRFGDLNVVANLWVEHEWNWQEHEIAHVYNPTFGLAYELSAKFAVGLEYWARGRFDHRTEHETNHFVGPTFQVQSGKWFMSVGAYVNPGKIAQTTVANDDYGKYWIRSIVGIDL